jgi:hypothetical protein
MMGRLLWFHSQNLNDKPGNRQGSKLLNGRAWLHAGRYTLGLQWVIGKIKFGAEVQVAPDAEGTLSGNLLLPLIQVYVHLDAPWGHRLNDLCRRKNQKYGNGRAVGFSVHSGALWWNVWADQMEWRRGDPKWMNGSFNPADFFLGRYRYSKREIERQEVVIPMPEGAYPATVVIEEAEWRRPRWPFPRRRMQADVKIPGGIPHQGKGENAWDCGDDATFGLGCSARTVPEAIGEVVAVCLKDRRSYGETAETRGRIALARTAS